MFSTLGHREGGVVQLESSGLHVAKHGHILVELLEEALELRAMGVELSGVFGEVGGIDQGVIGMLHMHTRIGECMHDRLEFGHTMTRVVEKALVWSSRRRVWRRRNGCGRRWCEEVVPIG